MPDKIETAPLDLTASRASFRDALLARGLSRPDAVLAAELFVAVVPKTLAALVPEELTAARAEIDRLTAESEELRRTIRNLSAAYHATTSGDAR